MAEFNELPEGCIAAILSHTTPIDACRFSLISKTFCSAADSDAVWNRFLPSDPNFIDSIISHSPSLANIPSKKDLYLALSDRPIIIDNGKKVFFFITVNFFIIYYIMITFEIFFFFELIVQNSVEIQSFQLDRKSGKKCYMLAARSLAIAWGDNDEYWTWITMPDSRLNFYLTFLLVLFYLVNTIISSILSLAKFEQITIVHLFCD
jgi:hypothetical protein